LHINSDAVHGTQNQCYVGLQLSAVINKYVLQTSTKTHKLGYVYKTKRKYNATLMVKVETEILYHTHTHTHTHNICKRKPAKFKKMISENS